jgi:hypothetical protein
MKRILTLTFGLMMAGAAGSHAIDHGNLDGGRPLRLEDAYSIAHGEWAFETGAGYLSNRRGSDQAFFPVEVLYGAFPNFHLELGTTFFTRPREVSGPEKSGDLRLGALYNFNQETLPLPAIGIKGTVNFPTGVRSSGTDFELKGMVTKSVGRLSLHGNAAVELVGGTRGSERDVIYKFAFGPSYPIGAPMYTRTTLLADLFWERAHHRGERDTTGVEAGFRHQLTERMVVDAGIGTEFRGAADRSRFFATTGISISF